jgi:pimeloyl-ACP methyl ester carboxylesterase
MVGHSFGGLYARVFASRYPDQVQGLVLIDSSHPDQWTRTAEGISAQHNNEMSAAIAPWLAWLGVLRATGYVQVDPDLPARLHPEIQAFNSGVRLWDSNRAVFRTIDQTMSEVRSSGTLGSMPLVVLTATEHGLPPQMEPVWQTFQRELAGLSVNSRQRVVQGATHVSLVNNREQSSISVEAIQQVVAAARTGAPLP